MRDMTQHFNEISASYNELRTTDPEPIDYIKEQLSGKETIRGVDIGCGSGRYDLLMLQKIPDFILLARISTRQWWMRQKNISETMDKAVLPQK